MAVTQNEHGMYEAQLGGHAFEFQKWGADESLRTLTELTGIVGMPMLTMALSMFEKKSPEVQSLSQMQVDPKALEQAARAMFDRLSTDAERVMKLIKKLSTTKLFCDGKAIGNFDLHYKGRLPLVFDVVRHNLEVQYGDFLADAVAAAGLSRRQTAQEHLPTSTTPTT